MLKFLSKVKIEFNPLDTGRTAACLEFLAQCNARRARDSNPGCQITVKRRTDNFDPQITVTFVNGTEEVIDAASTPAQDIREKILAKGRMLETEQMFREAGEAWPVMIPEAERKEPVIMGYKTSHPMINLKSPTFRKCDTLGIVRILVSVARSFVRL
ncbi:hypothetical protein AMTRI_Chr04g187440 [Amborella trichopoda]